jgi:ABC-type glycerol-3-phosphate transport system substrate-binding protein
MTKVRIQALFAATAALMLATGIAACGGGNDETSSSTSGSEATLIQSNPDNGSVQLTIG